MASSRVKDTADVGQVARLLGTSYDSVDGLRVPPHTDVEDFLDVPPHALFVQRLLGITARPNESSLKAALQKQFPHCSLAIRNTFASLVVASVQQCRRSSRSTVTGERLREGVALVTHAVLSAGATGEYGPARRAASAKSESADQPLLPFRWPRRRLLRKASEYSVGSGDSVEVLFFIR